MSQGGTCHCPSDCWPVASALTPRKQKGGSSSCCAGKKQFGHPSANSVRLAAILLSYCLIPLSDIHTYLRMYLYFPSGGKHMIKDSLCQQTRFLMTGQHLLWERNWEKIYNFWKKVHFEGKVFLQVCLIFFLSTDNPADSYLGMSDWQKWRWHSLSSLWSNVVIFSILLQYPCTVQSSSNRESFPHIFCILTLSLIKGWSCI